MEIWPRFTKYLLTLQILDWRDERLLDFARKRAAT